MSGAKRIPTPATLFRPVASKGLATASPPRWGAVWLRRSNPDANQAVGLLFPLKKTHHIRGGFFWSGKRFARASNSASRLVCAGHRLAAALGSRIAPPFESRREPRRWFAFPAQKNTPHSRMIFLERETGFEPAAFSLARRRSTPELFPH